MGVWFITLDFKHEKFQIVIETKMMIFFLNDFCYFIVVQTFRRDLKLSAQLFYYFKVGT